MGIIRIRGDNAAAARYIAEALRNNLVGRGGGGLILSAGYDSELRYHIEKLIKGDQFEHGKSAAEVRWKRDATIIVIGDDDDILQEIEDACPGFSDVVGKDIDITLTVEKNA